MGRVIGGLVFAVAAGQLEGQSAARAWQVTVGAGLNQAVSYHAPISTEGRSLGRSLSLGIARNPTRQTLAPHLAVTHHTALAQDSDITVVRVEVGLATALIRRASASVVPFLAAGLAAGRSSYDVCDVEDGTVAGGEPGCAAGRSGLGWQVTAGLLFPTRQGPQPSFNLQFLAHPRGFDGVAATLSLAL